MVPSVTRWAVFGCSPISARMAEAVLFLARSSNIRPVSTKVIIITEASNHLPERKATPVESATSVSMLAEPESNCFHAEI